MINFKTVKNYCNEDISLIENYKKAIADKEQIWHCHHRREMTTPKKELLEIGEYYNRPATELIFLTKSEHNSLHKKNNKNMRGKHHSEETRRKMSIALKGKTTWMKGKHPSEEAKRKLSEARKGKTLHWYNNGIKNVFVKECPEGFVKGRLKRKPQITV